MHQNRSMRISSMQQNPSTPMQHNRSTKVLEPFQKQHEHGGIVSMTLQSIPPPC